MKRLLAVAAIGLAGAVAAFAHYERLPASPLHLATASAATAAPLAQPIPVATLPMHGTPDFSAIVSRYGPAVVNISISGTVKTGGAISPFQGMGPSDPLYDFFRRFNLPAPQGDMPTHGLGSGFIVAPDGTILTNAHVVDGADEVMVKLTDKREFKAKVLGIDKATDIAVLRINADDLPTVRLGDPSQTRVGAWVLAIGSPFGFENSATAGIVSAKSRSLDEGYVPFIQTDVAVNPGNSGGPLFNANGEVIGINSQIYSRTGGYQGLSFAIPIDVAMKVEQQIVAHGKVERGMLGVTVQDVDQSLAEAFGLKKPVGALVSIVQPDGSAAKAKLQPGDVILAFNGTEISRSNELPLLVGGAKPGTTVDLRIWRKGEEREVKATLGNFNEGKVASTEDQGGGGQGRLGVAVRPLTPDERREADVAGGLLIENVSGAASRAGIQPGDVILSLNGEPVASVTQLRAMIAKAGKRVALLVQRNDAKIFVPVDLG
jgi:serine protease Do